MVSLGVEHSEDYGAIPLDKIEELVRKTRQQNPSEAFVINRKTSGICFQDLNGSAHFV